MITVGVSGIHGRGVFAGKAIRAGETFHVAHLMTFDRDQTEAVNRTMLGHYVFHVEDAPGDPDFSLTGLAMSPISFVNHSREANADFTVNAAERTIAFTASRAIAKGEEITIDYGDFAARLGID